LIEEKNVVKSYTIFVKVEMRRQSYCPSSSNGNGAGEPLIVVEESTQGEEEAERCRAESPPRCVDPDSPSLNPYLLSPWRDARKHSLPTPQCTSGITASQVLCMCRGSLSRLALSIYAYLLLY